MKETLELDASVYIDRLFEVYKGIDREYESIAKEYGFSCDGCEDNCCKTVFYHHTIVEYLALLEGFDKLPEDIQRQSLQRARQYILKLDRYRNREYEVSMMCPLNFEGLCAVYEHRPLICRIHGVPGVLEHPVKGRQEFKGCKVFERRYEKQERKFLDRTAFYTQIATLEAQLRKQMDYHLKFRKTIAEMISDRNLLSYRVL